MSYGVYCLTACAKHGNAVSCVFKPAVKDCGISLCTLALFKPKFACCKKIFLVLFGEKIGICVSGVDEICPCLFQKPADRVLCENTGATVHSCCRADDDFVFINAQGQLFAYIAEVFSAFHNADKVVIVFIKVGHYLVSRKTDLRLS